MPLSMYQANFKIGNLCNRALYQREEGKSDEATIEPTGCLSPWPLIEAHEVQGAQQGGKYRKPPLKQHCQSVSPPSRSNTEHQI